MFRLFVFYVGGSMPGSNVELHDVRFAVGEKIEDCYDSLRAQWWGTPESLHLDCWGALESADGHDISLRPEPYEAGNRLYFVNLGGYRAGEFSELHKNVFVVAPNESKAKVNALKTILDWESHHKDYQYEIEHIHALDEALAAAELYIHLTPTDNPKPFTFETGYNPIGKAA